MHKNKKIVIKIPIVDIGYPHTPTTTHQCQYKVKKMDNEEKLNVFSHILHHFLGMQIANWVVEYGQNGGFGIRDLVTICIYFMKHMR